MEQHQLEQIEKHIRNAWRAGAFVAAISFIAVVIGIFDVDFSDRYGMDAWSLVDVALMVGLSYGISRNNFYCALGLLLYYLASKLYALAEGGAPAGGILSIILLYYFFQGTRATFQLRRQVQQTVQLQPQVRTRGAGFYILVIAGAIFGSGMISLMIIGALSPDIEVVPGHKLEKKYLTYIREQQLIDPAEEVEYWYSDGFLDFEQGFYFFTNQQVVIYRSESDDPLIRLPFSEIVDMGFVQDPSFLTDSQISLQLRDSSYVAFPVSSENGGDSLFYERLHQLWSSTGAPSQIRHVGF